jgi:DNA modification methylase
MPEKICKHCQKSFTYAAADVRQKPREHRLLCADSRNPDAAARVMAGAKADLLWTDAPYGVSYVGKTKAALTIQNDGAEGLPALLAAAFAAADAVLAPGASFYLAAPAGPQGTVFRQAIAQVGWKFHQALVWVKNSMVLGHSDYHYRHEDVLYGWKEGGHRWYGDRCQTSVFEIDRPSRSEEHPTMKPPALIAGCLVNSTKVGDRVLDVFTGSGSTAVACEQVGRQFSGIELEPKFVAVVLERLLGMGLDPGLVKA